MKFLALASTIASGKSKEMYTKFLPRNFISLFADPSAGSSVVSIEHVQLK